MPPSVDVSICVTPPSSSSPGASSSASGSATNSAESSTETAASALGFHEELWDALRLGVLPDASPDALPAASPARQQRPIDEAGAGRPAGRSLQAELAMAALAEPDAPAADAEPMMPLAEDGEVDAAGDADDFSSPAFRMTYNKFLSKYRRWAKAKGSDLLGRALVRHQAALGLNGKPAAAKIKLARAFWAERPSPGADKGLTGQSSALGAGPTPRF